MFNTPEIVYCVPLKTFQRSVQWNAKITLLLEIINLIKIALDKLLDDQMVLDECWSSAVGSRFPFRNRRCIEGVKILKASLRFVSEHRKLIRSDLRSDSWSSEPYFSFISSRNSGNSIVPFPSRSASSIRFNTWVEQGLADH